MSAVWEYFIKIPSINSTNNKGRCKKCGSEINNSNGSTSAMINHMRNVHKISVKRAYNADVDVSSTSLNGNAQQKPIDNFMKKSTLGEIVSGLATKDGFTIRGITQSNFIRQALSDKGFKLPRSENGTMALIHAEYEKKKEIQIKFFDEAKKKGEKFSITLDEWVSSRKRRYMNINVHDQTSRVFNLGLVRIVGSCDAEKVVLTVTKHLTVFHLSFENDIVATTNDGASVMIKYGIECPAEVQLCLNHGIHLAVYNTFYYKRLNIANTENESDNNEDDCTDFHSDCDAFSISDDESDSEEISETYSLAHFLNKIRSVVKFFTKSTVRNDLLQKKVSAVLGNELCLKLDVKHRWNSIHPMLQTLLKLKDPIAQVLEELNAEHLISGIDFQTIEKFCSILEPISLSVLTLGRKDANLITATGAINFLLRKLDAIEATHIVEINELKTNIKSRLKSRMNDELNSFLSCLLQKQLPTKDNLNFGTKLMNRLNIHSNPATLAERNNNEENYNDAKIAAANANCDKAISLQDQINAAINEAAREDVDSSFSSLKQEFAIYKKTGKKTTILQRLYDAILTVRPTSTESERVFSVSSNFNRKLRSRLSDYSLNCLVFLKYQNINNS